MVDLTQTRVVVCGGTGDVGEGVVQALIEHGAKVALPARSEDKAARIRSAVADPARLTVYRGDLGDPVGAEAMAAAIAADGPVDAVVASLGGWWQGARLVDVAPAEWVRVLGDNLTSHYSVARAFMPVLTPGRGVYVQVLGAAAELPIAGSSLISITAAAAAMLGRMVEAERKEGEAIVRQLMIASIVATRSRQIVDPSWVTAREVGEAITDMIARGADGPPWVRLTANAV